MIIRDNIHIGQNIDIFYVKSDDNRKIRKAGTNEEPVDEAIYPVGSGFYYEETDIPVDAMAEEAPEVVQQIFGECIPLERAQVLVPIMMDAVREKQTDEEAEQTPEFYPRWSGDGEQYAVGDRVRYNGVLYKILQAHTSQPDWTPDVAVSLFTRPLYETNENGEQEEIPEWEQPDSTNTYGYGVKVRYNGQIWESTHDHNSWPPGTPGVWVLVEE